MILVTGTKRSGTSMWMQILKAAGFPVIGEPYMGKWEDSIKDANRNGFYESRLRQGVFYATNPHPETGEWLAPKATRKHVVKVFIPGLVRSDIAYVDAVVATMRPWREYGPSLDRLHAMEDEFLAKIPGEEGEKKRARALRGRSRLPAWADWWFETYDLVRDVSTRRYPIHLTTYDRLLADPHASIQVTLGWLGGGDLDAAVAAVEPKLRSVSDAPTPDDVDDEAAQVMDEVYATVHDRRGLEPALLERMNQVQARLVERFGAPSRERKREDVD
ncbi:MAG: hypothetical protein H6742_07950 [Alphaproteobacteria bacterium]|nr:hypothetical protein [Alphaproteobacteria bacterium]